MLKRTILVIGAALLAACYEPPQTNPAPAEVRVVYVYIDRDDCYRGMAPAYMHCEWGFYGRNRFNVMPMQRFVPPPTRMQPAPRPPRQGPPEEGFRRHNPRPNNPPPPPPPAPQKKPDA